MILTRLLCRDYFIFLLLIAVQKRGHAETPHTTTTPVGYNIVRKTLAYNGWRTIIQQDVTMRNGKTVTFDIIGQGRGGSNEAVTIFCWNTKTKTATLVREYHPGPNKMLIGGAAGIVEHDKHSGDEDAILIAARMELEEECHLRGGTWIPLVKKPIAMDKYTSTNVFAYLVMDADHVSDPKAMDDEEEIEIIRNVSCRDIMQMICNGEMNVVGSWICLLAMEKLRELGEIE